MIFKKKTETKTKTKVEKRVSTLSTAELLTWTDQVLYSVGRNVSAWQKSQDKYSLEEARMGAEALHAIMNALTERTLK
jgi:hypothetical protein